MEAKNKITGQKRQTIITSISVIVKVSSAYFVNTVFQIYTYERLYRTSLRLLYAQNNHLKLSYIMFWRSVKYHGMIKSFKNLEINQQSSKYSSYTSPPPTIIINTQSNIFQLKNYNCKLANFIVEYFSLLCQRTIHNFTDQLIL